MFLCSKHHVQRDPCRAGSWEEFSGNEKIIGPDVKGLVDGQAVAVSGKS